MDFPPWRLGVERRDRLVDRRGGLRHVHRRLHLPPQESDRARGFRHGAAARPPGEVGGDVMTTTDAIPAAPSRDARRVPGEPDMWFFVFFESLIFAAYFCVYLYFRAQNESAFLQAQSH